MNNTQEKGAVFQMRTAPAGNFDASYLLEHLESSSPVDIAVQLDTVISELTTMILDSGESHADLIDPLHHLRMIRNSILSGAGVINFK